MGVTWGSLWIRSERRNYLEVSTFCCLLLNQDQCTFISQETFIGLVLFLAAPTMYLTRSSLKEQRQILAPESISVLHGCQRPTCPILSSTGLTNTGHRYHTFCCCCCFVFFSVVLGIKLKSLCLKVSALLTELFETSFFEEFHILF